MCCCRTSALAYFLWQTGHWWNMRMGGLDLENGDSADHDGVDLQRVESACMVTLLVVDLDWVEFDLSHFIACLVLLWKLS